MEKEARFKVSTVLAKDPVPLMATLFYLRKNDRGLNTFIERILDHEPPTITELLQRAELIILEKGLFKLTKLGLETSEILQQP